MSEIAVNRTPVMVAAEINNIKEQTRNMVLFNSIEIGRRLTEAKAMVPHGDWGNWLKESVDYSQSTANNLMKIYTEYGSNSQALGNLNYTQAVMLLGLPGEAREEFVKENDIESMSTRQLQQAIKEKQQLEEQLRKTQETAEKERAARQRIANQYADLELKSSEHDEKLKKLNEELKVAKSAGDSKKADKLKASLEKSEQEQTELRIRIKELEAELKKKPIDVPMVVEKIPDETAKELEELRKKVTQLNDKQVMKFTHCFELVTNDFKQLLVALHEIKAANPEEFEKYKKAVSGLIEKMGEKVQC